MLGVNTTFRSLQAALCAGGWVTDWRRNAVLSVIASRYPPRSGHIDCTFTAAAAIASPADPLFSALSFRGDQIVLVQAQLGLYSRQVLSGRFQGSPERVVEGSTDVADHCVSAHEGREDMQEAHPGLASRRNFLGIAGGCLGGVGDPGQRDEFHL